VWRGSRERGGEQCRLATAAHRSRAWALTVTQWSHARASLGARAVGRLAGLFVGSLWGLLVDGSFISVDVDII
jgi:hypothetical protein